MYKFFVPDSDELEPDRGRIGFVSDKVPFAHSRSDIVPLYDKDGRLIASRFHFILLLSYFKLLIF